VKATRHPAKTSHCMPRPTLRLSAPGPGRHTLRLLPLCSGVLPIRPLASLLIALTSLVSATAYSFAETKRESSSASQIEETVVVASRTPELLDQLGVSVSVLNSEDIRSFAYPDLASLLDAQPGVTVTMDGGYGKAAAVRIRGEDGFRTRIVLDGINIADPSSPQISPRIEHIVSSSLSRVEVLRGPQGLLWGADAGGVILLSTVDYARDTGLDGFLEAGGDDYHHAAIRGVLVGDKLTSSASLAQMETAGFNARSIDSNNPDRDGYENTSAHATVRAQINPALSVGLTATHLSGDNDYDACYDTLTFALIHDCEDDYEQNAWRASARWQRDAHTVELGFASSDTKRAFYSAENLAYETRGETETTSLIGTWRLSEETRLTYGVDHESQSLADSSSDRSRDNTGLYLEARQDLGQGVVTAGWRYDDNEDFGTHNSWRLSGRYPLPGIAEDWFIRAAIGTGFRAPSLYEMAYNEGPFSYPPAAGAVLQEETSEGWEVGLVGSAGQLDIEVIWFDQQIEDAIVFDLTSYSGYIQTPGTSTAEGIELIASLTLSDAWSLEGNLTRLDATDLSGADRPYRPEQTGRLSLLWSNSQWSTRLTAHHTGKAVDPFLIEIDKTFTVDFSARWAVSNRWSIEFRVLNLTDSSDQRLPGYEVPGTTAYAAVRLSL
jgi:vitamin B12 transporter